MEIIVYLIIMGLVSVFNAWKKKQRKSTGTPPVRQRPQGRSPEARPQQSQSQRSRQSEARPQAEPTLSEPQEIQIPEFLRDLLDIPDQQPTPAPPPPKPRERKEYAEPDMPARQFHDHKEKENLHDWSKVHPEGPPIVTPKRKPKKKTPLVEMLSSKRSLRKSIIIKEILDKPISMRPRTPIGHK